MQVGMLGLGKRSSSLMEKLLKEGHEVLGWNKSKGVYDKIKIDKAEYILQQRIKFSFSIEGMREALRKPRVFWMMLESGEEAEEILTEIINIAENGDLIIDGGNSYFKDTQRRYDLFTPKGIKFLGIGITGSAQVLEQGYCLMVGGDKYGYEYLRPVLDSLALPSGGHNYFGTGGAGHFVKMVHNGIEDAMMQALSEGFGVLEKSPYSLNLLDIAYAWQKGGDIRSFLLDTALNVFAQDQDFISVDGAIGAGQDGKWIVDQGNEVHVPVDVIGKALEFGQRSQYDKAVRNTFAAKLMVAMSKKIEREAARIQS